MIRRPVLEEPVRLMEPLASRLAPDVLSRLRDAHAEPAERLRDLAGRAAVRAYGGDPESRS